VFDGVRTEVKKGEDKRLNSPSLDLACPPFGVPLSSLKRPKGRFSLKQLDYRLCKVLSVASWWRYEYLYWYKVLGERSSRTTTPEYRHTSYLESIDCTRSTVLRVLRVVYGSLPMDSGVGVVRRCQVRNTIWRQRLANPVMTSAVRTLGPTRPIIPKNRDKTPKIGYQWVYMSVRNSCTLQQLSHSHFSHIKKASSLLPLSSPSNESTVDAIIDCQQSKTS
jgi:hypothetical protein